MAAVLAAAAMVVSSGPAQARAPVDWHRCAASWQMPLHWQCARYRVPRDYRHPRRGSVSLAVARLPAADPARRRGSVFFNPGGPGASGLEAASLWQSYVGRSVRRRFDLVTWDPRGVGHSRPRLRCLRPRTSVAVRDTLTAVLDLAAIKARIAATTAIANGCAGSGLARFVTTIDNVRDLNRLRQAVGDQKLSYVGISYGTVIGAVYANLFPRRYRALVLHGLVDSVTWFEPTFEFTTDDAVQLQNALNQALRACDNAPSACALAPGAPAKYAQLQETIRDDGDFAGLVALSHLLVLGSPELAGHAASALKDAYDEIVVDHLPTSPELLAAGRRRQAPDTWSLADEANAGDVRDATLCSDAGSMPRTWPAAALDADQLAPVFGVASVLDRSMCARWHAFGSRYTGRWNRGRAPILLLNQRWDYATPLAWARTMADRLGRTRLITISGWGHGIETRCSTRAVDRYLLTGKLPATRFCNDGRRLFRSRQQVG